MDEVPNSDEGFLVELQKKAVEMFLRDLQGGDAGEEQLEITVLGQLLKSARENMGIHRDAVAREIEVEPEKLTLAEGGFMDPDDFYTLFPVWAEYFGYDPSELLEPGRLA